jgi:hypothetical protein
MTLKKCFSYSIKINIPGHWWLIPILLATQEAEIRRIMVQGQPMQQK